MNFATWSIRNPIPCVILFVVLTLAGLVTSVVLFPLLIAGPRIIRAFKPSSAAANTFATIWDFAYWPVTAGITIGVLTAMYHFATPFRTKYRRDLPGAVFAFLLWVVGSWALRAYARWSIESSPMYGSLAAPLVVLGWLYFTSFAVLMGAEVNSVVEILWPAMTRKARRNLIREAVEKLIDDLEARQAAAEERERERQAELDRERERELARQRAARGSAKPIYTRWWFWGGLAAVAGAGAGGYLLLRDDGLPSTDLGNVVFD